MGTNEKLLRMQHKWPTMARDIALLTQPQPGSAQFSEEDIARSYDLTSEEFATLVKLPAFIEVVRSELQRVKELGPFAGHKLRSEAMLTSIQERLYQKAMIGDMDDKQMLQFLGMLLKSVGLDAPEERKQEAVVQNQTAVNIAFNLPKLPTNRKLSHLMGQPQTNVIDVGE